MTYIFKCIVRPIISVFRASDTQKIKDILSLRVTTRRQSPPIKQTTSWPGRLSVRMFGTWKVMGSHAECDFAEPQPAVWRLRGPGTRRYFQAGTAQLHLEWTGRGFVGGPLLRLCWAPRSFGDGAFHRKSRWVRLQCMAGRLAGIWSAPKPGLRFEASTILEIDVQLLSCIAVPSCFYGFARKGLIVSPPSYFSWPLPPGGSPAIVVVQRKTQQKKQERSNAHPHHAAHAYALFGHKLCGALGAPGNSTAIASVCSEPLNYRVRLLVATDTRKPSVSHRVRNRKGWGRCTSWSTPSCTATTGPPSPSRAPRSGCTPEISSTSPSG